MSCCLTTECCSNSNKTELMFCINLFGGFHVYSRSYKHYTYIGETARHLVTRIAEHTRHDHHYVLSSVEDHIENCLNCKNNGIGITNFKILKK